jgi:hypothetical protein
MQLALYPHVLADHSHVPNTREQVTQTLNNHASDHNKYAAEIVAIERHLGINPAGGFDTVVDRLDDMEYRIGILEQPSESNFVSRAGDTMTGNLTVPGLVLGNVNQNQEGIIANQYGYWRPLEQFVNDAYKVQDINGVDLFVVPFSGAAVKLKNGATVLTDANHIHRNDAANDLRYFLRSDNIGHRIKLAGAREAYNIITLGAEGTETVQLQTDDYNHFKIRTNGASANVEIIGIPTSDVRKGITICLQNMGSTPAILNILNSNVWVDYEAAPSLTTNPGKDTEVFAYTIGEGDRWVIHPYYINETVRTNDAVLPVQATHYFKFFGRSNSTPLTIADELTAVNMNLVNSPQVTVEGVQFAAATRKYGITDVVPGLTLQNDVTIISVVKNIQGVEEFAVLGAVGSTAGTNNFNYLRGDKLSNNRLRARLSSQAGAYDNGTEQTPSIIISSGQDNWTAIATTKTSSGYGIYNLNSFAQGLLPEEYLAFRNFPTTVPTFEAAGNMRLGLAILPRASYTTSPTGLGSFLCAATVVLEGDVTGVELMQVYRALRQSMLGIGITSLPAPTI